MSAPVSYFELIRQMKNPFSYRLRLVRHAREHGIKATARDFRTTVPTVRKWVRRWQQHGLSGLKELSRAPHSCPHKVRGELARCVIKLRRQLPTFGARRLQREWDLPLGHGAIERLWRQHGLLQPRRRKYQKKQDLARWKQTWALFQQISADTKDLDDIPHYWPQMKARGLPAIQYTARQVRSGLQFLAYSSQRSAPASERFAERIQRHLARCGVTLRDVTWQTDNGGEFIGELQPDGCRSHFPRAVTYFGSQHERIPPAAHTFQSDVETVHRLITFHSRADFLAKVSLYQLYFNLARPNSHKGGLTPWQIIQQLEPRLPLKLGLLPPVLLDYRLDPLPRHAAPAPQGGYDLPRLPSPSSRSVVGQIDPLPPDPRLGAQTRLRSNEGSSPNLALATENSPPELSTHRTPAWVGVGVGVDTRVIRGRGTAPPLKAEKPSFFRFVDPKPKFRLESKANREVRWQPASLSMCMVRLRASSSDSRC